VDRFLDDVTNAYRTHIEDADKEYHFLILISFLVSWGFIRISAHMIRAQVSWWPGNVETKGGTHIHHMFWGILLVLSMGYIGLSFTLGTPWIELVAIAFGVGMGLTLDEFALWLNLEDVYWAPKGRQSIDAVIAATVLLVIALIGAQFWIDLYRALFVLLGAGGRELDNGELAVLVTCVHLVGLLASIVCILKRKIVLGILGLFIPIVSLIGALRPAKPGSRWARLRRARSTA
jgi:hypothetical protein